MRAPAHPPYLRRNLSHPPYLPLKRPLQLQMLADRSVVVDGSRSRVVAEGRRQCPAALSPRRLPRRGGEPLWVESAQRAIAMVCPVKGARLWRCPRRRPFGTPPRRRGRFSTAAAAAGPSAAASACQKAGSSWGEGVRKSQCARFLASTETMPPFPQATIESSVLSDAQRPSRWRCSRTVPRRQLCGRARNGDAGVSAEMRWRRHFRRISSHEFCPTISSPARQ